MAQPQNDPAGASTNSWEEYDEYLTVHQPSAKKWITLMRSGKYAYDRTEEQFTDKGVPLEPNPKLRRKTSVQITCSPCPDIANMSQKAWEAQWAAILKAHPFMGMGFNGTWRAVKKGTLAPNVLHAYDSQSKYWMSIGKQVDDYKKQKANGTWRPGMGRTTTKRNARTCKAVAPAVEVEEEDWEVEAVAPAVEAATPPPTPEVAVEAPPPPPAPRPNTMAAFLKPKDPAPPKRAVSPSPQPRDDDKGKAKMPRTEEPEQTDEPADAVQYINLVDWKAENRTFVLGARTGVCQYLDGVDQDNPGVNMHTNVESVHVGEIDKIGDLEIGNRTSTLTHGTFHKHLDSMFKVMKKNTYERGFFGLEKFYEKDPDQSPERGYRPICIPKLGETRPTEKLMVIDDIVPKAYGGIDHPRNWLIMHRRLNSHIGDKDPAYRMGVSGMTRHVLEVVKSLYQHVYGGQAAKSFIAGRLATLPRAVMRQR